MAYYVSDCIKRALEHIQVAALGQANEADEVDLCLRALASMLDAAQLDPMAVVGLQTLTFTPAAGAQTVTFGDGQDIDMKMPVSLELSSVYRVNGVDVPIGFAPSFDEYAAQADKATQGTPQCCFYMRGNNEVGTLYLWPASDGSYQLRLQARQDVVAGYESLATGTQLTLPNGYRDWLEKSLAVEIGPTLHAPEAAYAKAVRAAGIAARRLKRANFVSHQLRSPAANGGAYNIQSDV